jgi:hypothetical protein
MSCVQGVVSRCVGKTQSQNRRHISSWPETVGCLLNMTLTQDFERDMETVSLWYQLW